MKIQNKFMKNNLYQQLKKIYAEHKIISIILIIVCIGLLACIWYISLPLFGLWYIWKKSNWRKTTKIKISAGILILVILGFSINAYTNRTPILSIINPQDNFSIQASSINIQGKVSPSNSTITVNRLQIETQKGQFDYKFILNKNVEKNQINIVAQNGKKTISKTITINRIFTDQEKADIQANILKAQQAKDAEIAKEKIKKDAELAKQKAEQEAYNKSPAGRLCIKHSDWSESDCESVANKEYWIGMSIEMLKAERGLYNHLNTSNYGSGNEYQMCWDDYNPSCFYAGSDQIITGYN